MKEYFLIVLHALLSLNAHNPGCSKRHPNVQKDNDRESQEANQSFDGFKTK